MSATSQVKAGILGGVYHNSGSYGSPTWAENTLVRDVSPSFPWDMGDASTRASRAKLYGKTQIDIGFQLVVRADDADTKYGALWDAAVGTSPIDLMILDGKITTEGAMGWRTTWHVSISGKPEGAGDNIYTTFDLKPAWNSSSPPQAVEMGATSTPSFTAV